MSKLPQTKTENIVVQDVGDEILIYNLILNKAFCLGDETSALVYNACDGKTEFEDFKRQHNFPDDLIFFALDELQKQNLIENNYVSPLKRMKRREVIKKLGLATMVVLPIIAAITAPAAVQAASICGGTMAAGFILGCTVLESQCLNMNQTCASCSTTAVLDTTGATCPPASPFVCVCN